MLASAGSVSPLGGLFQKCIQLGKGCHIGKEQGFHLVTHSQNATTTTTQTHWQLTTFKGCLKKDLFCIIKCWKVLSGITNFVYILHLVIWKDMILMRHTVTGLMNWRCYQGRWPLNQWQQNVRQILIPTRSFSVHQCALGGMMSPYTTSKQYLMNYTKLSNPNFSNTILERFGDGLLIRLRFFTISLR